jgi:hypothetical protein
MTLILIGLLLIAVGVLVDKLTVRKKEFCSVHSWARNSQDKLECRECGYVFGSDLPEPHPFDD